MRRIYLNDEAIKMNIRCGLTPQTDCPAIVWARQNGISCKKNHDVFFEYVSIHLRTGKTKKAQVVKQIQNICDKCRFGDEGKTR